MASYARLREEVFLRYGGRCVCCGESDQRFLSVDHTGGGGRKHLREIGSGYLYHWLRKMGFPAAGFQILCHNCNRAKGTASECPHQTDVRAFTDALLNYVHA